MHAKYKGKETFHQKRTVIKIQTARIQMNWSTTDMPSHDVRKQQITYWAYQLKMCKIAPKQCHYFKQQACALLNMPPNDSWMWLTEKISPVKWLPLSDLDLGSGHTAYRRATFIDLYLRTKCHWDRKKFFFESHHCGFGKVQSYMTPKVG